MKVRELIAVLQRYDQNAEVLVTWEKTTHELDDDLIYLTTDGEVFIDGDGGHYKKSFGGVSK